MRLCKKNPVGVAGTAANASPGATPPRSQAPLRSNPHLRLVFEVIAPTRRLKCGAHEFSRFVCKAPMVVRCWDTF
jgi:hypothetical protein